MDGNAPRGLKKVARGGCDGVIVVVGPGSISTTATAIITFMTRLIVLALHNHTIPTKHLSAITTMMLAPDYGKLRVTREATGGISIIHPVLPARLRAWI